MDFRTRLLRTLRALEPVLAQPGVLVVGSEVPNLLEPDARSSLVVSQDVDIAIHVQHHAAVKALLGRLDAFAPSQEEPSVLLPRDPELIEVNFIGMDAGARTYVLEDEVLPLLVFGQLSLLRPGGHIITEGLAIPVPRPAGLVLEKLVTDRSGEKGDRDLLVALALLLVCQEGDRLELVAQYRDLPPELRHVTRSGLATLSLLEPRAQMPNPTPHRAMVAELLKVFEREDGGP